MSNRKKTIVNVLMLFGVSGSGKNYLENFFIKNHKYELVRSKSLEDGLFHIGFHKSIQVTTRARRKGEENASYEFTSIESGYRYLNGSGTYHFIDDKEYNMLVEHDMLIGKTTGYEDTKYGTLLSTLIPFTGFGNGMIPFNTIILDEGGIHDFMTTALSLHKTHIFNVIPLFVYCNNFSNREGRTKEQIKVEDLKRQEVYQYLKDYKTVIEIGWVDDINVYFPDVLKCSNTISSVTGKMQWVKPEYIYESIDSCLSTGYISGGLGLYNYINKQYNHHELLSLLKSELES